MSLGGCNEPFCSPCSPTLPPGTAEGEAPAPAVLSGHCCWWLCLCLVLPEDRMCPFLISSWVWVNPCVSRGNSHHLPAQQLQQRVSKATARPQALAPFSVLFLKADASRAGQGHSHTQLHVHSPPEPLCALLVLAGPAGV